MLYEVITVRALKEIKKIAPELKTALLVDENENIDQKLELLSFIV